MSAATCATSDGTERLTVDNTLGNGAAHGCLVDYSSFPTVRVRVYNEHGFWTKIAEAYNLNDVGVAPDNVWAKFGYIAPGAYAEYVLTFDATYNSRVMFFVNAAASEDGRLPAGVMNVSAKILATLDIEPIAAQLGDLQYIVQAVGASNHLVLAADALSRFNLVKFLQEFNEALGDDQDAKIICNIAARFGKVVTASGLKTVFTGLKILLTAKDTWETVWSIATGSYAGSVMFSSKVRVDAFPPHTNPAPPPLSTPTPVPTADSAGFVRDATLPDGANVAPGQSLQKTWRVKNTGTSTWDGYKLIFVEGDQMGGTSPVSIPTTAPNQEVNISVSLRAPSTTGNKVGYWQIVNRDGVYVEGGRLSVNINVVTPTTNDHIAAFSADPGSPSSASTVRLYARVNWWERFRAMRAKVDNQVIGESSAAEHTFDWNAAAAGAGDHTVVLEVADQTDTSWSRPERRVLTYTLQGTPAPANHAPNRPTPVADPAYNWYVTIGNAPQLAAQTTDPDGDSVQYWFHAEASVGSYDSGWTGSHYSFGSINPGTYEWKVKAKDEHGAESDWSDPWHFSVESSGVSINEPSVTPGSPSSADRIDFCVTTSGHATVNIDVRALVNTASDGSANGEWRYLDGYLPGNNQWCWWWNTLEYGDGDHLVRFDARAWEPAANDVRQITYHLNHRRPPSPVLVAPIPASGNIAEAIYLNSRTVTFQWKEAIRATSYTLRVSTQPSPKDDPNPVLQQTFGPGVMQYTATLTQDYPTLYWQVSATNDVGTSDSGAQRFGIDRAAPSSAVQPLAASTAESAFPVYWQGSDSLSGMRSYDIQYLDSGRGDWTDWLIGVPASKTYELFTGQPGHTYAFRCRGTDNAGNTEAYPAVADTSTKVDPASRPATPWWNAAYAHKRNIVILNNMPATTLPVGYPVHLHFDSTTTPTAAEIYNASLSNPKGNDVRIVYNDTTELDRIVKDFSPSTIDIWFRSQVSIASGGSNSTAHQLYYGNASAGTPPASLGTVFDPPVDANTVGLWYMNEGAGSTLADSSGYGNNGSIDSATAWATPPKFSGALHFPGGTDGPTVSFGSSSAFDLQTFTFEMWMRHTGNPWGRLAGHLGNSQNRWLLEFGDSGALKVYIWPCSSCGAESFTSNRRITDTNWHHVAVTLQNSTVRIYIDGQLDSSGQVANGNIRSGTPPLTIGSAENICRAFAEITHVRLSNIARTSFPYGAFAAITNEPTLAVGDPIAPPETGSADLAVLSLAAYPNVGGGTLVQAVVRNQGTIATQNGFYTDLYADHLPTGPGDYEGSLHFWVASPIEAGKSITLTTVLTSVAPFGATAVTALAANTPSEATSTLYLQVDSTGAVAEGDKANNTSAGTDVCLASADAYEGDDSPSGAKSIAIGAVQTHNISGPGDQDWVKFAAQAGSAYVIRTANLGPDADTYLYLYDTDGATLLASNDDYNGTLASQIEWTAPATGTYYVLVRHWNPNAGGCGTSYDLSLGRGGTQHSLALAGGWNLVSLPVVPDSTIPSDVLAPIDGKYDWVYAYDAEAGTWHQLVPGGSASDLAVIDETMGLWVHATHGVTFAVTGSTPIRPTVSLTAGWNLVGYPSLTPRPVADALASIAGKYDRVYAYNSADPVDPWKKYDPAMPGVLNDLVEMAPGRGYWIHVTEDCTWTVP